MEETLANVAKKNNDDQVGHTKLAYWKLLIENYEKWVGRYTTTMLASGWVDTRPTC